MDSCGKHIIGRVYLFSYRIDKKSLLKKAGSFGRHYAVTVNGAGRGSLKVPQLIEIKLKDIYTIKCTNEYSLFSKKTAVLHALILGTL